MGNAEKQIEKNNQRIKELEILQTQLTNTEDKTLVTETIQALTQQNTSLQERLNVEEQTKTLFGWLFKLLAKN